MKSVSISKKTLAAMAITGTIYKTAKEAQDIIDKYDFASEGAQVAEAYEMSEGNKRLEHSVFRGYVINW